MYTNAKPGCGESVRQSACAVRQGKRKEESKEEGIRQIRSQMKQSLGGGSAHVIECMRG